MSGTKADERSQNKAQDKKAQDNKAQDKKAQYNAFLAACPSRQLLDRISNKWVVLVLCALGGDATADAAGSPGSQGASDAGKVMRYSELARQLVGVSQKMLTQTLRALERDGLLTRTVVPTVPVSVSYQLTALGHSLHQVAQGLRYWAQENMGEVIEQRRNYDDGGGTRVPAAAGGEAGVEGKVEVEVVNRPPKTR